MRDQSCRSLYSFAALLIVVKVSRNKCGTRAACLGRSGTYQEFFADAQAQGRYRFLYEFGVWPLDNSGVPLVC